MRYLIIALLLAFTAPAFAGGFDWVGKGTRDAVKTGDGSHQHP